MRLYSGFGSAEDTNKRFKYLLEQGQTGLSIAFDLPTQLGYDSDHLLSEGEVGKVGVAISSLRDMETLFNGIPLDKVSTSMTINAPTAILLAMYIVIAEKQGTAQEKLRGTVQNDILKEYVSRGNYIFPPCESMKLTTDVIEYCSKHIPRWNSISVSGYHFREAGATATQETAFTLADGMEYVKAAMDAGLSIDEFAPRVSFFFNAHIDFFEEIAKFRAARRVWAKIMRERYDAKNPRSWMLRFHTQTAGCSLAAQQPLNNIIRTAVEALSAVLGGTQSLHTNSYDEALALPSEEAVTTALRTQQIIAEEIGVTNTIDPLAGSYFVESLTNEIEEGIWDYIKKIDALGGATSAVEEGFYHREIANAAYRFQKEVENEERTIVAVNRYIMPEETPIEILKVDSKVERVQKERLKEVRGERDAEKVEKALLHLEEVAEGDGNVMYPVLDAVRAYATLGEMCDVLRDVYGEYKGLTIY
jgi:methylmalonyl-CoA mutase N-terminal domain/subunit